MRIDGTAKEIFVYSLLNRCTHLWKRVDKLVDRAAFLGARIETLSILMSRRAASRGRDAELRALKRVHLGACSVRRSWYRSWGSVGIPWRLRKASESSGKLLHSGKIPKFFGKNLGNIKH